MTDIGLQYPRSHTWALQNVDVGPLTGAVALLGPNGAGKTSLFRVLTTTLTPTTGEFGFGSVSSADHTGAEQMRRRLGYLPQDFDAFGGYTCAEFLRYVAWLRRIPPASVEERVTSVLAVVDLTDRAREKVKSLSGGMRQRLGLAQALVSDPDLLLLDEPTVGLDPQQRASFIGHVRAAAASRTVLLATHLVEDVARFAHHVIILDHGRVVFAGSIEDLCGASSVTGADVERAYLRVLGTECA